MKTSNILLSSNDTQTTASYKIVQNIEEKRKKKKLTLYFKLSQTTSDKYYINSLTIYNINGNNDKWWKNNNNILRLDDTFSSVSKLQDFDSLDVNVVRRYIFIQSLGVAIPEFHNTKLILSVLRNKILDKPIVTDLDFKLTLYKDNILRLINSDDFIALRTKVRASIVRALESSNPTKKLEDSLKRLPYYKTYEEIRTKLAKKALEEFAEKDNILKIAYNKKEEFLDSLSDILMPHEKKIMIYEEMCDAFKPVFKMYKNKIAKGHIAIRESLREAIYKNDLKKLFEDLTYNKTDLKRKHFVAIVAGFIEVYLKDREHDKQIAAKLAKLAQLVLKHRKENAELNKLYLELEKRIKKLEERNSKLKQGYKEIKKENENLKHRVSVLEKKLKIS